MARSFIRTITKDVANDFSCRFSDIKYEAALTSGGGAKSITVPGGRGEGPASQTGTNNYIAIIKVEDAAQVWVSDSGTATAASSANFTATASELVVSGMGRYVKGGSTLSFITPDSSADVSVVFYAVP